MVSRILIIVPIVIVAIIIGFSGMISLPSDVNFPFYVKLPGEGNILTNVKQPVIQPPSEEEPPSEENLSREEQLETVKFPRGIIKLDDILLEVQVADNKVTRTKGLMFQEQLPLDQGMLFVHKVPTKISMWMKNMLFSLDIIWIDSKGKIIYIEKNIPICDTINNPTIKCPTYINEKGKAKYVLEVTAGFVKKNDISKESTFEIISLDSNNSTKPSS